MQHKPVRKKKPAIRLFTDENWTSTRMMAATKKLIKQKGALGYGSKVKGFKTHGKDWMHPEVRKVLNYMGQRHVFDNMVDTRVGYKEFFQKSINILSEQKPSEIVREELKLHMLKYINHLSHRHGPGTAKPELATLLRKSLARSHDRAKELISQTRKINIRPLHESAKTKDKSYNYYASNARDAFAHLSPEFMMIESVGEDVLLAAEEVEKSLKAIYGK